MTTAHLTGATSRTYAERLLTANDPDAVAEIVSELEDEFDVVWKPLGDDENNYSDVYAQAASPIPAFCELPLNSEDSQMLRFYEQNADDVDPQEYTSMKAAVESGWVDLDDAEVEIIADGRKPSEGNLLNLTVRDNGKGKGRNDFDDFVDLHAPGLKKQKYGFLQGQHGMGSTAVLQFCGNIEEEYNERAYKFIASASVHDPEAWTYTLIHNKPHRGRVEYLTVGGEFPIFDGTFGEALVEKHRESYESYDFDAHVDAFDPMEHGAFVKVYDYRTNASRALISGDEGFRRKFERCVVDSPFPIRLTDMRYDNKLTQSTTRGFLPAVRDGNEHLVKGEEHITKETGSETLGERDIHIVLFKSDSELEDVDTTRRGKDRFVAGTTGHKNATSRTGIQKDHAVMLTINGQTHGSKGEYFLKRLGYSKVAEDTVVIVEFDDLANLGLVNMFSASRDTLKDTPQSNLFLEALEDALEDSDLLSDEEDRRRAKRGSEETEVDTETFSDFVQKNPEFANYITTGEHINAPRIRPSDAAGGEEGPAPFDDASARTSTTGDGDGEGGEGEDDEDPFDTPQLPTYLRPIREYDPAGDHEYWDESEGIMPVEMPVNQRTVVRFETDAQSNYLVREVLSGSIKVSPSARFEAVELQDGLLTLTISPAESAETGDDFGLTVELTRPDPADCDLFDDPAEAFPNEDTEEGPVAADGGTELDTSPLTSMFTVEYTEPEEAPDTTPSSTCGSTGQEGEDSDDEEPGSDTDGEATEGEQDGETREQALAMPEIHFVYEEDWRTDDEGEPLDAEAYDPEIGDEFDEHRLVQVDESRDGTISGLTLTINMDAAPLRSFIVEKNVSDTWKEFVENQYRLAVVFYTICEYRGLVDEDGTSLGSGELMPAELVDRTINALGPALMPTIIPEDQLDRITE
jgi:hypothetical protein